MLIFGQRQLRTSSGTPQAACSARLGDFVPHVPGSPPSASITSFGHEARAPRMAEPSPASSAPQPSLLRLPDPSTSHGLCHTLSSVRMCRLIRVERPTRPIGGRGVTRVPPVCQPGCDHVDVRIQRILPSDSEQDLQAILPSNAKLSIGTTVAVDS